MALLRTFIILLLTLTVPVSGMAAAISAPNCRMSTESADSGMTMSHTMADGAHADQKMDHTAHGGHAGMQHGAAGQAADGKGCTSDCPCCGSDCACSGAIALMRSSADTAPDITQNIIAVKSQVLFSTPFNTPYRPPTFHS